MFVVRLRARVIAVLAANWRVTFDPSAVSRTCVTGDGWRDVPALSLMRNCACFQFQVERASAGRR